MNHSVFAGTTLRQVVYSQPAALSAALPLVTLFLALPSGLQVLWVTILTVGIHGEYIIQGKTAEKPQSNNVPSQ